MYFVSGGPGRGIYMLSQEVSRNCQPMTEIKSFYQLWQSQCLFGIYCKGVEGHSQKLMEAMIQFIKRLA